jgi:Fe-S cluster assembly protein SufD
VNEVSLGSASRLRVFGVQEDNLEATNVAATYVNVARDARFSNFNLSLGGRMSRHETRVALLGQGADCKLDGAYLMRGREHCDNTLHIDHLVPDTTSDVMFKGVLDDESRAVFQGKIVVHRDAQRTDGQMNNKTMLLSDSAEVNTKPELEIYADDVKCSHGAASGHVDEDALFYMRSRGIPDALARNLLIQSFLGQVLERINVEPIRDALVEKATQWLPAACYRQQEWIEE